MNSSAARVRLEPQAIRTQANSIESAAAHYSEALTKISARRLLDDDLGYFGRSAVKSINAALGLVVGTMEDSRDSVKSSAVALGTVAATFENIDDEFYEEFRRIDNQTGRR